MSELQAVLDLHKALADETRVRMLVVLQALGELCVCDLEVGLDVTQSRASRHMSVLRSAGLVDDRRDGQWVYYRIATEPSPSVRRALASIEADAAQLPALKADIAATRKARRSPCR